MSLIDFISQLIGSSPRYEFLLVLVNIVFVFIMVDIIVSFILGAILTLFRGK